MQTMLYFAGPLAILAMTAYLLTLHVARRSQLWRVVFLGGTIAVIRIGAMAYLQLKAWNRAENLADLPLVFLVLPEAFVSQYVNPSMAKDKTALEAALLGLLLAIGSFALARLIVTIERNVPRRRRLQ
jgi:NO-binding membrane sensor protein with MHYT domain